jgi:hypothetical protein
MLKLEGYRMKASTLLGIVEQHKETLRELHLMDMFLEETSLRNFLRHLREDVNLKELVLGGAIKVMLMKPILSTPRGWIRFDFSTASKDSYWFLDGRWQRMKLGDVVNDYVTGRRQVYPMRMLSSIRSGSRDDLGSEIADEGSDFGGEEEE